MPGLDVQRNTDFSLGSINKQVLHQYPLPFLADPFPLGRHALPLKLLDHACTQVGPKSSLERRVEQHDTHTRLINESTAALTNFPTPADLCIGPASEAGLSNDI